MRIWTFFIPLTLFGQIRDTLLFVRFISVLCDVITICCVTASGLVVDAITIWNLGIPFYASRSSFISCLGCIRLFGAAYSV